MGAIGDPRADVGYLLATYSEPNGRVSALGSSPVTAEQGFPSRAELVERYVSASGRTVEPLAWFEALALWKAAVFCEAIYGRYIRGELGAEDTRAAIFETGVPLLAATALETIGTQENAETGGCTSSRPRRPRAASSRRAWRRAASSHPIAPGGSRRSGSAHGADKRDLVDQLVGHLAAASR